MSLIVNKPTMNSTARRLIPLVAAAALFFLEKTNAFVAPRMPPSKARTIATSLPSTATSLELPAGLEKTILEEGAGFPLQRGDIATLKYSCYVVSGDNENAPPFCKSTQQKMIVGDGSMIAGWETAVRGMRVGERSIFRLSDPALGYGANGVPPLVPPNAVLELDVQVLDASPPNANIDFDNLALDSTPTTAAAIARAYEARQAAKGQPLVEEDGFKAFLTKAKNFYFFGLFEGETGERPPWFLRPSITFPLAFLVVGATFYVTFSGGGISERGAMPTDELDEIILSSSGLAQLVVNALLTTKVNVGL